MILRALFWIAVVAVLMPHNPDLGLSPSGAKSTVLPPAFASVVESAIGAAPEVACRDHAQSCAAALGVLDNLQSVAISSLAQVKAEIEASRREQGRRDS